MIAADHHPSLYLGLHVDFGKLRPKLVRLVSTLAVLVSSVLLGLGLCHAVYAIELVIIIVILIQLRESELDVDPII